MEWMKCPNAVKSHNLEVKYQGRETSLSCLGQTLWVNVRSLVDARQDLEVVPRQCALAVLFFLIPYSRSFYSDFIPRLTCLVRSSCLD